MRRTFAEILNSSGVNIAAEYHSLHMLVFERHGFYSEMDDNFDNMPFSGTAYNLRDFNDRNGFHFEVDFQSQRNSLNGSRVSAASATRE